MQNDSRLIVGSFSSLSNATQAADQLGLAGYSKVRLVDNPSEGHQTGPNYPGKPDHTNNGHEKSSITRFFARLFNLDEERPAWKPSVDAEAYFQDAYNRNLHLVLVENCQDTGPCREIIRSMGGTVEDRAGQLYEHELQRSVQLRSEVLDVHKDRVKTGDVQVRKEIITETKRIEVPVTRQEIVVERQTLEGINPSRRADDASDNVTKQIRIPISEEQVHIEKKVVPREEVRIYKDKITETQVISEDVRHEEARLEADGRVRIREKAARSRSKASDRDQDAIHP